MRLGGATAQAGNLMHQHFANLPRSCQRLNPLQSRAGLHVCAPRDCFLANLRHFPAADRGHGAQFVFLTGGFLLVGETRSRMAVAAYVAAVTGLVKVLRALFPDKWRWGFTTYCQQDWRKK